MFRGCSLCFLQAAVGTDAVQGYWGFIVIIIVSFIVGVKSGVFICSPVLCV